jgi:hypothetical protein
VWKNPPKYYWHIRSEEEENKNLFTDHCRDTILHIGRKMAAGIIFNTEQQIFI